MASGSTSSRGGETIGRLRGSQFVATNSALLTGCHKINSLWAAYGSQSDRRSSIRKLARSAASPWRVDGELGRARRPSSGRPGRGLGFTPVRLRACGRRSFANSEHGRILAGVAERGQAGEAIYFGKSSHNQKIPMFANSARNRACREMA